MKKIVVTILLFASCAMQAAVNGKSKPTRALTAEQTQGIQQRITHFEQALQEAKTSGNNRRVSRILSRLGRMYVRLDQKDKAKQYLNELLVLDNVDPLEKKQAEQLLARL